MAAPMQPERQPEILMLVRSNFSIVQLGGVPTTPDPNTSAKVSRY